MTSNSAVDTTSGASKESLGKALGRMASGVYVVTANDGNVKHGLLATWVSQAGFEPPQITVAVNKHRPIMQDLAQKGARFTVNILSKSNMDVFKAFAAPAKEGVDRFEGLKLKSDVDAGPVFADCIAYLDCEVSHSVELTDHTLVVGTVLSGNSLTPDAEPMVHLRKNGFQY
jgi:flavin reductase (DIM6/NTAB) family NADH-FMN oxidoreductase RutF